MERLRLAGRWTLVTGASSGLGLEMARQIARDHHGNLLLVARRSDRLAALADELRQAHGVAVECISADMCRLEDVDRTFEQATDGQRDLCAAVLNAGVTYFGEALEQSLESFLGVLHTNIVAKVRLVHRLAPWMQSHRPDGAIMLVSSVAGFSPMPYQAVYGGSKAFMTNFAQALIAERRGQPPSITVFAPGGIATEMLEISGLARKFKPGDVGIMDPAACARIALDGMLRRRALVIPGALNKLMSLAMRFAPRQFVSARVADLYRSGLPS